MMVSANSASWVPADPIVAGTRALKKRRTSLSQRRLRNDVITPARRSRDVAARIPGARLEVLAGCGHLVMLERPDVLDALLESFSAELSA